MRIIQLTPGTGSFYCGTCVRDNALVVELRRQGHDALLVPMYLAPMLDEAPAAGGAPLFYGGVNVYLQQVSGLFRKTPRWVDRLLDSPAVLQVAASKAGSTRASELGELTVSTLRGEEGRQVKELERLVEWLSEVRPDVVCLSNALLVGLARRIKQRSGAAVVCTLQGEDAFLDSLPAGDSEAAWQTLAERAADVDAFVAVSHYYGDVMRERARLPADRVHVVHNGILLDGYAPAPSPPDPPALGFLARLYPTKGLEPLVEAYIVLRKNNRIPDLKLRVAGSMTATDEAYVQQVRGRVAAAGLAEEVTILPNLSRDEKVAFLQSLSVLSVPATYGESFGLYVIEALAAGVPVVQPRHAAFPELIEATGGGVLCEPDDPLSLAAAVEDLLRDPAAARAMGARGRQSVLEKFSVERMTEGVVRVFESAGQSLMPYEFKMVHRVEFADTDMAGIIHFASYFRYLEVTEHAFFRSLGLSIMGDPVVGWPRVHVACDFKHPLRFEDEVEAHLRVRERKERALTYDCVFRRVSPEPIVEVARAALTVVCVTRDETGRMRSAPIPEYIAGRIEAAPAEVAEGG